MPTERDILQLLRDIRRNLDGDVSLTAMAARAGWSRFHFHRAFRRVTGETPKQYSQRLRLEHAATRLVTGAEPIVSIAAGAGFSSHEVFTRAFRRHFGRTPAAYRLVALENAGTQVRARHAAVVAAAGPCVGLIQMQVDTLRGITMPSLSIERRDLPAQPILLVRLRTARHELAAAIAQGVTKVYMYAQKAGLAFAGHPFTRYLSTGPGLLTIEVGFRFAGAVVGEGEVEAGELQGGPAVVAVHGGPYDQLGETYAAMERWMEKHGLHPGGAAWEHYVTDPAEHPDPADWRTEIYWPVAQ
jgi:AraC family transcriptional regulator